MLALSDHLPDLVLWDGTTGEGVTLELRCTVALGDVYEGASIAVNGTCLTVTHFHKDTDEPACTSGTFVVNMAPETLRCTNLGKVLPASGIVQAQGAVCSWLRATQSTWSGQLLRTDGTRGTMFRATLMRLAASKHLSARANHYGY